MDKHYLDILSKIMDKYPSRYAACDDDSKITYKDLDSYSAKVYSYLKNNNIGKEDVVLIVMKRSVWVLPCIVGILKAGAAFISLEDTYPADRIEYIKKDANPKMIIDDDLFSDVAKNEHELKGYETTSDHDLAYIVYTSGSTGNPKGVLHEYGNIDQQVICTYQGLDLPQTSEGFVAPYYFVAATIILIKTTIQAKTLYIIQHSMLMDFNLLSEFIYQNKLESIYMSPSYIRLYTNPSCYLKQISTGSEPANNIYYEGGKPQIINKYSLSECGFILLQKELDRKYDIAPVGQPPLEEIDLHLVDDNGKRVDGPGKGEICFKNEFVRGYLNLEDKTKKAFRGGYFYTGDIARKDEHGDYYIIGRKDDMFKINGNRIEPAEIEAKICEFTGLKQVVAKGFNKGGKSFICLYYLTSQAADLKILDKDNQLVFNKNQLQKILPDYMMPSYYIGLDRFPVNANGKLYRLGLEAPDISEMLTEYVPPNNQLEKSICNIMEQVLNVERIGIDDDFYSLGGDSISAIEFISEFKNYKLSIDNLIKLKTPRKIAKFCEDYLRSEDVKNTLSYEEQKELVKNRSIKDYEYYLESGKVNSYYALCILWNNEINKDPNRSLKIQFQLNEMVDKDKLLQAVEYTSKKHPFITFSVEKHESNQFIQYKNTNKPVVLHKLNEDVVYGSDKNNNHFVSISCDNDIVEFCISHLLTDGYGMSLVTKCIFDYYFDLKDGACIDVPKDFLVDLMSQDLPLSNSEKENNQEIFDKIERFRIPEQYPSDFNNIIKKSFEIQKKQFSDFCDKYKLSLQLGATFLISLAIQNTNKDNVEPIAIRMPINTRNILGAKNTFQNSSTPHIIIKTPAEYLDANSYKNAAESINKQFSDQFTYEYLAKFTNIMASTFRSKNPERANNIWKWYFDLSHVLVSYLGRLDSKNWEDKIKKITSYSEPSFKFTLYLYEIKDKIVLNYVQLVDNKKYFENFCKLIENLNNL